MKKLALLLAAFALVACSSGSNEPEKTGKGESTNSKGQVATAEVTMQGDKITKVSIDDTYEVDGKETTKRTLKDEYGMKAASGIGKEWWEQADFLQEYIVKNGVDGIKLDEEGKPTNSDVLTGCTMSIENYVEAVKKAVDSAK